MGQLNPVTLDFETYYTTVDNGAYTLSRMTTEEYVRDPRFEIIGVSIKHGDAPSQYFTGDLDYIRAVLHQIDWANTMAIGHNKSEFDSFILTQVVGVRPRAYACTLQMARALHGSKDSGGKNIANGLGALCEMYGLAAKGNQVKTYVNRRRESFSPAEMADYAEYCGNKVVTGKDGDTDLCWELFKLFAPQFPRNELQLASLTTRMFAEPRLVLDLPLLEALQLDMAIRKGELLDRVAGILGVDPALPQEQRVAQTQSLLRKDEVLANVLRDQFDVAPPTKLSPKRKNPDGSPLVVYAFAKTDEGMAQLLDFEDESDPQGAEDIQALAAARLGVKSTLAESRVDRFVGIARRGPLPVPLAYGKVGTHRLAGAQKINMQNLSGSKQISKRTPLGTLVLTPAGPDRLDKWREVVGDDGGPQLQIRTASGNVFMAAECHVVGLRDTIMAPPGKKLVVADSSQIELRVCHLLAGQMDTVEELRQGIDVYSSFASTLYHRPITKRDKKERQHGKVGMLQLQYQSGWKSFRNAARIMGGVRLTEDEAAGTVDTYRNRFTEVRKFWRTCQQGIPKMASGGGTYLDQWGLCKLEHNRITSPGRLPLVYHNLRQELLEGFDGGEPELQWVYDDKEKRSMRKIYGGSITENCLCADTKLLTLRGWTRIVDVLPEDLVWDGEEFVEHRGVVDQGVQEVGEWLGIRGTRDHLMLAGDSWRAMTDMGARRSQESLSLGRGLAEAWLSSQGEATTESRYAAATAALSAALRIAPSTGTDKGGACPADAPAGPLSSRTCSPAGRSRRGGGTDTPVWSRGATTPLARHSKTTVGAAFACATRGLKTVWSSFVGLLSSPGVTRPGWTSTASTTKGRTPPTTAGWLRGLSTAATAGATSTWSMEENDLPCPSSIVGTAPSGSSPTSAGTSPSAALPKTSWRVTGTARVYDLLDCGPRHRFVVLSDMGPVVAHNCCQWLARNVVFDQMLECEKRWGNYHSNGTGVVLTVHDEIVLCVDEDDAEESLKFCLDAMSEPPKWWPQLPVAAEGGIGQRYAEAK